jgi:hypothetical protein
MKSITTFDLSNKKRNDMKISTKFQIGQEVKYLGYPAKITGVETSFSGTFYHVKYNKGYGITSANYIHEKTNSITI